MQDSPTLTIVLIGIITTLGGGAFKFLLDEITRLRSELAASNSAKEAALLTAAELGKKAPELQKQLMDVVMENMRLHQRINDAERQ